MTAFILLIIIISFAFLYNKPNMDVIYTNYYKKNLFTRQDELYEGFDGTIPKCYDTVEYNPYRYTNDDYVLKTEMVAPVCPACPSYIDAHGHSNIPKDGEEVELNIIKDSEINNNTKINNTKIKNTEIDNKQTNTNINTDYTYNIKNGEGNKKNEENLKNKEKQIKLLEEQLNAMKNSQLTNNSGKNNGDCPACPPCGRCPEPSVSCERVVNYRSPNVGKYLPMPVLNDFSTFD
jgi:hypothetical protein